MKAVYKYDVPLDDKLRLSLPKNAAVLSVQVQGTNRNPQLWALVDTEAPLEDRYYRWFGTGHEIPLGMDWVFIATVQTGPFVFHLFEELL